MRRLLLTLIGFGALAVVGAALFGPPLIDLLFGNEEVLGPRDLALIAAFASLFMIAGALIQALIAMNDHARMAVGAVLGVVVLLAVIAAGDDLYLRVELGLVASGLFTSAWMAAWVWIGLRAHHGGHEIDLAEELAELPLQP